MSLKKKMERWKLEEAARFRKGGVKGKKGWRRFVDYREGAGGEVREGKCEL